MNKNVGGIDKTIRIILGTSLLLAGFFVQMTAGWRLAAFVISAIAYVTAFSGF